MRFIAVADTDIGNIKTINQDSIVVKHAAYGSNEVLMAVICDGMGGLSKGELASGAVARSFSDWFDNELCDLIDDHNIHNIGEMWCERIKELNVKLIEYGKTESLRLGTTFTGILFIGKEYVIAHVGDSRTYFMDTDAITQITEDQTFVEREISRGTMTLEEAENHKRRNVLLQCVGASKVVEPQVIYGETKTGAYVLCTDGFRHQIGDKDIFETLNKNADWDKDVMKGKLRYLIDLVKARGERDNISAIMIRVG